MHKNDDKKSFHPKTMIKSEMQSKSFFIGYFSKGVLNLSVTSNFRFSEIVMTFLAKRITETTIQNF